MAVNSSTTARPMSTDNSRSSTSGGRGTTMMTTTPMMAAGASRWVVRRARGVAVVVMTSEHQLLQAHEIRQHLGDGAEEICGDRVADLGVFVEGPGQGLVLDDGHVVLSGEF